MNFKNWDKIYREIARDLKIKTDEDKKASFIFNKMLIDEKNENNLNKLKNESFLKYLNEINHELNNFLEKASKRQEYKKTFKKLEKERHSNPKIAELCESRDEWKKILKSVVVPSVKLTAEKSLKNIEESFNEFLKEKRARIETIYLSDNELINFLNNTSIKYLLLEKIFNKRTPIEEKVKRIIKEMTFSRFDEKYLKLIYELDEVKYLKNEELLIEQTSRIIEKIVNDGLLLPLYQKRYSIYVKNKVKGIDLDYYGRPLFQGAKIK